MTDGQIPSSRPLPDVIGGRYRVVSRLGVGGMGIVYKAIDEQLNRPVAVKALGDRRLLMPGAAGRLRGEALAAASLDHPYICQVYELVEAAGETFIVMEYVEGETLASLLKRDPLSLAQILQLGREIAEGLANAHARGLVHRDVKPSNVMMTPHGHVKLLDFGVSGADVASTPGDHTHTVAPQITVQAGTPQYMAPEQAAGQPVTARADLFSLGVLLYECLTGQLPFSGSTTFDYVRNVMQSPPRRLHRVAPDTPADLVDLVECCLEKTPAARPESADVVVEALRRLADALSSPGATVRTAKQARSGRRWKIVAALALAFAVAAVGWRAFWPDASTDAPLLRLRPFVTTSAQEFGSRLSPDGQWVSFLSSIGGVTDVLVQQVDGGDARTLTIGRGTPVSLTWSPDGRQLACILAVDDDALVLHIYPAFFGGALQQSIALTPTLTPTPTRVRLLRWIDRTIFLEVQANDVSLQRVDLDTPTPSITNISMGWPLDGGTLRNVDVHPDSHAVALIIWRAGQDDLWIADLDGSRLRALTNDAFFDRWPLWSGRGDRIIFQSNRGGQIDLWELDPATGAMTPLTSGDMEKIAESTSADGSVISVQRLSQDAKLWSWQVGDTAGTQLTQDALSDYSPIVGGRMLTFQRSQPVPSQGYALVDTKLFIGPLDRGALADQVRPVADGYAASLSHDGEWLAYLQTSDRPARTTLHVRQLGSGATTVLTNTAALPRLSLLPVDWASRIMTWSPTVADLFFVDQPGVTAIRRYRAGAASADPPLAKASDPLFYIRDPHVSPDGRFLGYLLNDSRDTTVVHAITLETGDDREWAEIKGPQSGVFARGWLLDGTMVLVHRVALHEDRSGSGDLDVIVVGPAGAVRPPAVRINNAFIATTRLHPDARALYVTRTENGVHNLYAFSFTTLRLAALTRNTLPGVTYSGIEPLDADTLIGVREERRQDIWLLQESTASSGTSAGR